MAPNYFTCTFTGQGFTQKPSTRSAFMKTATEGCPDFEQMFIHFAQRFLCKKGDAPPKTSNGVLGLFKRVYYVEKGDLEALAQVQKYSLLTPEEKASLGQTSNGEGGLLEEPVSVAKTRPGATKSGLVAPKKQLGTGLTKGATKGGASKLGSRPGTKPISNKPSTANSEAAPFSHAVLEYCLVCYQTPKFQMGMVIGPMKEGKFLGRNCIFQAHPERAQIYQNSYLVSVGTCKMQQSYYFGGPSAVQDGLHPPTQLMVSENRFDHYMTEDWMETKEIYDEKTQDKTLGAFIAVSKSFLLKWKGDKSKVVKHGAKFNAWEDRPLRLFCNEADVSLPNVTVGTREKKMNYYETKKLTPILNPGKYPNMSNFIKRLGKTKATVSLLRCTPDQTQELDQLICTDPTTGDVFILGQMVQRVLAFGS